MFLAFFLICFLQNILNQNLICVSNLFAETRTNEEKTINGTNSFGNGTTAFPAIFRSNVFEFIFNIIWVLIREVLTPTSTLLCAWVLPTDADVQIYFLVIV